MLARVCVKVIISEIIVGEVVPDLFPRKWNRIVMGLGVSLLNLNSGISVVVGI